jgi:hypothetical protein
MAGVGRPVGTSAITATPWAARSKWRLSPTETPATTSAQGTLGATRRSTRRASNDAQPTTGVRHSIPASELNSRQMVSGTLPLSTGSPRSVGSCETTITTPIPLMKPTSTGRARNSAMSPRRRAPATSKATPVRRARAARRAVYCWAGNATATGARTAAAVMAIVELGPTSSSRQVPKVAYSTPAASAV